MQGDQKHMRFNLNELDRGGRFREVRTVEPSFPGDSRGPQAEGVQELALARYLESRTDSSGWEGSPKSDETTLSSLRWCMSQLRSSVTHVFDYLECCADVGILQVRLGHKASAVATRDQALAALDEQSGRHDPLLLSPLQSLAVLQESLDDLDGARALLERAVDLADELCAGSPPAATARMHLAAFLHRCGHLDLASRLIEEASRMSAEGLAQGDLRSMVVVAALAGMKAEDGDLEGASDIYQSLLEHAHAALEPHHPFVAAMLTSLGGIHLARNDPNAALSPFREALGCYGALHGQDHPAVANALNQIASAHLALGNATDGRAMLRKALAILEKSSPESFERASTLNLLAEAEAALGNPQRAERLANEAIGLLESLGRGDGPEAKALARFTLGLQNSR